MESCAKMLDLDKYNKTVKYTGDAKETEFAYERLALWLLAFGKKEGTITSRQSKEKNNEIFKSA